jgi:hypothetical protein
MRAALLGLGLVLAAAQVSAQEAARGGLTRTSPMHLGPPFVMPFEKAVAPPLYLPPEQPASIVVKKIPDGMDKLGRIDRRLSEACQAGTFREVKPSKMVAVSKNATLGVAFGHGLGLVDLRKLADRGKVYYFYHGSTSLCVVRAEDNWDPRYAGSRTR